MRALLDTHILIWGVLKPARLGSALREALEDPVNDVFFSAASIWEVAIRHRLGRADFRLPPDRLDEEARAAGFVELPIRSTVCSLVADLPYHHRDPFDRLLIAQAMANGLSLYTEDARLAQYGPCVTFVSAAA